MTPAYDGHMADTAWTNRRTWVIIPCGAAKAPVECPARDLYVGGMFRNALDAASSDAFDTGATVLILSALHGLITLDTVIAPYDVKMGDAGSVTADTVAAQATALGIQWLDEVYAFLPGAYLRVADTALRSLDVYAQDVYEADAGIGYQRGTLRHVRESAAA